MASSPLKAVPSEGMSFQKNYKQTKLSFSQQEASSTDNKPTLKRKHSEGSGTPSKMSDTISRKDGSKLSDSDDDNKTKKNKNLSRGDSKGEGSGTPSDIISFDSKPEHEPMEEDGKVIDSPLNSGGIGGRMDSDIGMPSISSNFGPENLKPPASSKSDDDDNNVTIIDRKDGSKQSDSDDDNKTKKKKNLSRGDSKEGGKPCSSYKRRQDDNEESSEGSDEGNMSDDSVGSQDYRYQMHQDKKVKKTSWGFPIDKLPQVPECFTNKLPELRREDNHIIFFQLNGELQEAKTLPQPLAGEFRDNWSNDNEVKMPCSKDSIIPDSYLKGRDTTMRWKVIKTSLEAPIAGPYELEEAILSYNSHYSHRWNFHGLHAYFRKIDPEKKDKFFTKTLIAMKKLALLLPNLFKKSIPFLKQRICKKLTFSQQQVACLLANAFFCTFPRRNLHTRGQYFPDINFSSMFAGPGDAQKISKIECILHYFERVTESMPKGVITYSRQVLENPPDWENLKTTFTELHMTPVGTIEDKGKNMLQMDFANKYVGGGVLSHGCVQEEIRFLICPEMIISRLFTEVLLDDEVLIMTGCERFSSYTGYSKSFRWSSDFVDDIERDEWGRKYTEVVAMDALHIRKDMNQFEKNLIKRELNKAYCAFKEYDDRGKPAAVCTGNWGCGAFGGDPQLKALIQIMAASHAKRDICYLSVGNEMLCRDLTKTYESLKREKVSFGDLFQVINEYSRKYLHKNSLSGRSMHLLEFLSTNLD